MHTQTLTDIFCRYSFTTQIIKVDAKVLSQAWPVYNRKCVKPLKWTRALNIFATWVTTHWTGNLAHQSSSVLTSRLWWHECKICRENPSIRLLKWDVARRCLAKASMSKLNNSTSYLLPFARRTHILGNFYSFDNLTQKGDLDLDIDIWQSCRLYRILK